MTISAADRKALEDLDARIRILLPEEYQDSYETRQPIPMPSTGLKYAADGSVAWDEMWGSFCDLAMAGGPPHKGTLLEPGTRAAIEMEPDRYQSVVDEICRGVTLATDLPAAESPVAGWVRVQSYGETMAAWLLRAIVMENVAIRADGRTLDLPAAPGFRLEKEIKNVVTVIAKTSHYWLGHMPRAQRTAIGELFAALAAVSPLVAPLSVEDGPRTGDDTAAIADRIQRDTGLRRSPHSYTGWLGVECPSVGAAVWMMRALVVGNVLARREADVLFVPIDPAIDPGGTRVASAVARTHRLAAVRGLL